MERYYIEYEFYFKRSTEVWVMETTLAVREDENWEDIFNQLYAEDISKGKIGHVKIVKKTKIDYATDDDNRYHINIDNKKILEKGKDIVKNNIGKIIVRWVNGFWNDGVYFPYSYWLENKGEKISILDTKIVEAFMKEKRITTLDFRNKGHFGGNATIELLKTIEWR